MGRTNFISGVIAAIALLTSGAACADQIEFTSSGDRNFDAWRSGFAERALAQGRSRTVVQSMLSGLSPDQRVIDADQRQPEFTSPVWDYVTRAVSERRIAEGRQRRAAQAQLFAAIEQRYGVDADIIAGIWAMETNFGGVALTYDAPRALATLAYEGRRRAQFEGFLLALMEMVDRGYAGPNELKSSWAGALGQPQFMPDVFLTTAADWDGDGKRDIWNNEGDVLASIGNYLADRGWRRGEPVFDEVRLPDSFDHALADPNTSRLVSQWAALGIRRRDGGAWTPETSALSAQLFLPAGAQGPALLLYPNFNVIKRYNNSDRYAMGVSLLARGFKGRAGLIAPWPSHLGSLSRDEILELQTLLKSRGYYAGEADGLFGSGTRAAVRGFQQAHAMPADGFPTMRILNQLRGDTAATASQTSTAPASDADAEAPSASAPRAAPRPAARQYPNGPLGRAGIRDLQRTLQRLGFSPGPADGEIGARTRQAIRAFERSVGRRVTGRATGQVLNSAHRALARGD
ncbi:MAG: lytic murein transglycosylase [Hyphomonadaceae bacterium]|nr:lytic murein transglycosylase [Hyphomonadaceae bacterium]